MAWPLPAYVEAPDHEYPGTLCLLGLHFSPEEHAGAAQLFDGAMYAARESAEQPADPFAPAAGAVS